MGKMWILCVHSVGTQIYLAAEPRVHPTPLAQW